MASIVRRIDLMESQTIGYHRGETETQNADFSHCRGIDLRFFDDEGKFEPGAIEHFPKGEKLPNIKPSMGPLRGFVFSEASMPQIPSLIPTPVDVYPGGGGMPWYGSGWITQWCNRFGFSPLGYPARHRSQDRSKPPTHTTYPWGGMQ